MPEIFSPQNSAGSFIAVATKPKHGFSLKLALFSSLDAFGLRSLGAMHVTWDVREATGLPGVSPIFLNQVSFSGSLTPSAYEAPQGLGI